MGDKSAVTVVRTVSRLGLVTAAILASVGCSGAEVYIYVDNAGKEPMKVSLDDQEQATIASGQFGTIECEAGKKKLRVECGAKVLYAGTKNLKKSDKWGMSRRYFFNPDNRNRYVVYTIKYGTNRFEGLVEAGLANLAGVKRSELQVAYQKLASEMEAMPSDSWFEVPDNVAVLTPPPDFVVTRSGSERRRIMTRASVKDHAVIQKARNNKNPTKQDFETLIDVVDRIWDEAP
jgi:hypothetical protein